MKKEKGKWQQSCQVCDVDERERGESGMERVSRSQGERWALPCQSPLPSWEPGTICKGFMEGV